MKGCPLGIFCHHKNMKERLMKSLAVSVEWRIIAFLITNIFLWLVTGEFWQSTVMALGLQAVLFFAHFGWYFIRETHS
jgi:hypothetical protein